MSRGFLPRPGVLLVIAIIAGGALGPSKTARATDKPLFELGIVGGGGYLPDYPASDQNSVQAIALPYVAYRGEILRAGDKGFLRGRIIRTDRLEFDLSLSGSFPVDEDNDARRGMDDLDWLGEIGPRLQITLARAARDAKIDLELPVRVVFSTDFTSALDFRGFVFAPELAYQNDNFLGSGAEVKVGVGANFATEKLMDYFYEVPARFATPSRPAFDADAGYLGSKIQLVVTKQVTPRVRTFFMARGEFHQGATSEGSPLFRQKSTLAIGFGLVISFYQSGTRAQD